MKNRLLAFGRFADDAQRVLAAIYFVAVREQVPRNKRAARLAAGYQSFQD